MKTDGINALMGIIPIPEQYDINHNAKRINTVYVINHYAPMKKGSPEKKHRVKGPVIPEVGSLYRSNGTLPCKPSYKDITNDMDAGIGGKHHIEIRDDLNVYMNGVCIAYSPLKSDAGKKKTSAQRLTFCKAVIHALINDDMNLDSHAIYAPSKMVIAVPQKEAEIITGDLVLPEELNAYTPEALTGYPEITDIDQPLENICHDDVNYNDGHDHINDELFCIESVQPILAEMYAIYQEKPIMQKWTHPHLRCNIIEVCTA